MERSDCLLTMNPWRIQGCRKGLLIIPFIKPYCQIHISTLRITCLIQRGNRSTQTCISLPAKYMNWNLIVFQYLHTMLHIVTTWRIFYILRHIETTFVIKDCLWKNYPLTNTKDDKDQTNQLTEDASGIHKVDVKEWDRSRYVFEDNIISIVREGTFCHFCLCFLISGNFFLFWRYLCAVWVFLILLELLRTFKLLSAVPHSSGDRIVWARGPLSLWRAVIQKQPLGCCGFDSSLTPTSTQTP